jgi:hypothetical protein
VKNDSGDDRHYQGGLRRAAVVAALVGTTLLAVACGGAHSTAAKASSGQLTAQDVDTFAKCMRGHGLPDFYPSRAATS